MGAGQIGGGVWVRGGRGAALNGGSGSGCHRGHQRTTGGSASPWALWYSPHIHVGAGTL